MPIKQMVVSDDTNATSELASNTNGADEANGAAKDVAKRVVESNRANSAAGAKKFAAKIATRAAAKKMTISSDAKNHPGVVR
jgi:cell division protein FtsI (penicillin-binding protein 3)